MATPADHPRVAHLHCLYCGAERRGDDSACRKCLAAAPSVPCRRCQAQVFAPHTACICGEPCAAWALAAPEELSCPRCKGRLSWVAVDDGAAHVEQCARCLGCFVRTEDWSALVEHEAHSEKARDPFIAPPASLGLPRQDLLADVACPHCHVAMDRARFAQKAALVVDVCAAHGVWLDAGELLSALDHLKHLASGDATPDAADVADQQHWDHVLAERALEMQQIESHLRMAETLERGHRTRNVVLGTAVGGPWMGLFMAMRKPRSR